MSQTEVGIVISAKDDGASSTLKKVGAAGSTALGSVRSAANKAGDAFKMMGASVAVFNQALELGKKAWEVARMAIFDTVQVALTFRRAGDPVLKWFEDAKREATLFRARIGDVMIPVIQGIAEAFGPMTNGMSKWIQQNRVMLGLGVVEWLTKIALLLNKGIAVGIIAVARAWLGWQMIIEGVQVLVNEFFVQLLDGIAGAMDGISSLLHMVGKGGLAASVEESSIAVRGLSVEFENSGDQSAAAIEKAVAELDALEKKVGEVERAIEKGIGEASEKAAARVKAASSGEDETPEKQLADIERMRKAREDAAKALAAAREQAQQENMKRMTEEAKEQARVEAQKRRDTMKTVNMVMATSQQMATAIINAYQAEIEASGDASRARQAAAKQALRIVLDTVMAVIMAKAAEAAADQMSDSVQNYPAGIGIAIGAGLAAAAYAAVMAYAFKADGGFVGGSNGYGAQGADVHPIMAGRNEYVMTQPEVAGLRKLMGAMVGPQTARQMTSGAGGQQRQATGGGDTTIINNRTWVPNSTEEVRMSRRQSKSIVRLRRLGMAPA